MSALRIGRWTKMAIVLIALIGFVWITLAEAEDVYNFYFQKGPGPQTVIQGGSGQTAASAPKQQPIAPSPEPSSPPTPPPVATLAAPENNSTYANTSGIENKEYKPITLSLGYGKIVDPVGDGMAYSLSLQYNFNRFLGLRAQGRWRNLDSHPSTGAQIANPKQNQNRLSGMLALSFTPLRLDLLGHRFIEFSAYGGMESYRKWASEDKQNLNIAYAPIMGASAFLGLNENVGIELQANRSTKATFVGGNLAFQF